MTHYPVTGSEVREIGRLIIAFSEALGVEPGTLRTDELCELVREMASENRRLEQNEEYLELTLHLLLGCCDGSDVPCEEPDARDLDKQVRQGEVRQSVRTLQATINRLCSEHLQAAADWQRNDEQVLAENQRLQDELTAQNRLYRKVGSERDEKQFEIERLRRLLARQEDQRPNPWFTPPGEFPVEIAERADRDRASISYAFPSQEWRQQQLDERAGVAS